MWSEKVNEYFDWFMVLVMCRVQGPPSAENWVLYVVLSSGVKFE